LFTIYLQINQLGCQNANDHDSYTNQIYSQVLFKTNYESLTTNKDMLAFLDAFNIVISLTQKLFDVRQILAFVFAPI